MANTTFSGPIKAGTIKDTTGTTVGTDVKNTGWVVMSQSAEVVFGADGSSTVIGYLPANSQVLEITTDITTAFNAATTNTFDIGTVATVNLFCDALAAGTVARVLASSDASQVGNYMDVGTSDVSILWTYNQSGTAASAGAADVTITYLQNRDI
jgi:hypothetical protein|tara:strand:- start:356 stop:817 length:462 start_codon:yes stop_codon:yes gene_type:complete